MPSVARHRRVVGRHIHFELGLRRREHLLAATVRPRHVVEVGNMGRVGGRFDGGQPRDSRSASAAGRCAGVCCRAIRYAAGLPSVRVCRWRSRSSAPRRSRSSRRFRAASPGSAGCRSPPQYVGDPLRSAPRARPSRRPSRAGTGSGAAHAPPRSGRRRSACGSPSAVLPPVRSPARRDRCQRCPGRETLQGPAYRPARRTPRG